MFGNLLNIAMTVIPTQEIEWHRFKDHINDPILGNKPTYFDKVIIKGSFQSADVKDVKEMGLDITRNYKALYSSHRIENVQRGDMPDLLIYDGKKYTVVGDSDWYAQDGWKSIVCIEELS